MHPLDRHRVGLTSPNASWWPGSLNRSSRSERRVMQLAFYEQLSHSQIAEALDLPRGYREESCATQPEQAENAMGGGR